MGHAMTLPIPFGWFAVAHSTELPPGEVQPKFFFDEHLVLFRAQSGKAHLLEAHCPHLGAHLGHGGMVRGDAVVCPFHGWAFSGGGRCLNVPYASAIPKRAANGPCLHSYPVQERNRMIWAWHHPRRLAPLWDLDDVPELNDPNWGPLQCYDWEIDSSIQESGENAVDIAHFVTVHGAQTVPKARIVLDGHRRETELIAQAPAFDDEGNIDFTRMEPLHLITRSCGPGMSSQAFSSKLKTVLLGTITPITATRLKLCFVFTKPRNLAPQLNALVDGMIAEVVRQVGQDIPIWENKIFRESPILCDGDGPIAKYRKWFAQFYDERAARLAPARSASVREPRGEQALANH